jgi:hypothetical protein
MAKLVVSLLFAIMVFIVVAYPAMAQEQQPDLDTMLRDAAYVLNRYEEATTGYEDEVAKWDVPDSLKRNLKELIEAVRKNVDREKPELNVLLGKKTIPSAELFDVYAELQEIVGALDGESSDSQNFGENQALALELTKLGAKTRLLAANIGIFLRRQIEDEELRLKVCSLLRKSPPQK